ncbi:MAG: M56 family metallopeptidase, partial [Ruminococcaceae bacterium]|nr:M56 family metallopeptidase [Oscillospiraceae bacterium]
GAVLLFAYFLIVYLLHIYRLRGRAKRKDPETLKVLASCKETLHIRRRVCVINGRNPMLVGLLKPRIVLPEGYSPAETKSIFLHELCHLKHHDILLIWLSVLVLCFNWFNPILWYSFFLFRRDIELYCDERVLRYTESRKAYAELLLKTALKKNMFVAGTTSMQNGEKEVSRRIRHMAGFKKPTVIWSMLILLLSVIISVCCLTNAFADYSMSAERADAFTAQTLGPTMADIAYADADTAVFHCLDGLFVYDLPSDSIRRSFDLSKLECAPYQQGSYGLSVTVSTDGKQALLASYGTEEETKDFKNYILDLETGRVRKTRQQELRLPFLGRYETGALVEKEAWYSNHCVKSGERVYYLAAFRKVVSNITLVITEGEGIVRRYPFGIKEIEEARKEDGDEIGKTPLYLRTEAYLRREFHRVYTPHYEILNLEITNWLESENEAMFYYEMTHKNYDKDPDTVGYIIEARERNDKNYEALKEDYLAPHTGTYFFKVVCTEKGELQLYYNVAPKGQEWQSVTVDDFIISEWE